MGARFQTLSLRTRIGAAVLTAVVGGLLVGGTAITTVHQLNADAAAAQDRTLVVESAVGDFSKNIESFSASTFALQLYPQLADLLNKGREANKAAVAGALSTLRTQWGADAAAGAAVSKAEQDWQAFVAFVSAPGPTTSPQALEAAVQQYNKLYGALTTDSKVLHDRAVADAQQSMSDARTRATRATWTIGILLAVGTLASLMVGLRVAQQVRRSVHRVSRLAKALSEGDLTHASGVTGRDEIGQMARALDLASARLRDDMVLLASTVSTLQASAGQLTAVSGSVEAAALEASTQAASVAAAATVVSNDLHTVSAGSREMGSSIRDISVSTTEATEVAAQAVQVATSTNNIVSRLGESSNQIATVVKVITSIAEQTNLLALNATIEAARAGEAGKGFAVVAGEVKDLAQETAKATEDISRRVQAIQGDTASAVTAITEIGAIIERINGIQVTIASAVEEQTATTQEMNRTLTDAANGAETIASTIDSVSQAAHRTSDTVGDTRNAGDNLANTATQLQALVSRFRY